MKWMRKLKDRAALPKNVQYANMPGESAARENEIMVRTKSCCGGSCLDWRLRLGRAEFVFHGEGIALELQDTQNVTLRGIGSSA